MERSKLGDRIRNYRERQDISRAELAERAKLEEQLIEAVEDNDLYPSLGPLLKITRALGVRLGTFIDDEVSKDPYIVRENERTEALSMTPEGENKASLSYHSLGKGKTDRHMEPFHITIEPDKDKSLTSHEGEEFIIVIKGKVELLHGGEEHILEAGDSLYFNSVVPHHIGAYGDGPAEIYAVLYFPE